MSSRYAIIRGFRRIVEEENLFLGIAISFILAVLFSFTSIWQLVILAAFLGGIFYSKMSKGALASLIGVGGAWLVLVVIELVATDINILLNQISGIILGSTFLGWIFVILVILLGAIFGSLGGALGSGLMSIFFERGKDSEINKF